MLGLIGLLLVAVAGVAECQRTHATLSSADIAGKRVFIVGDVHGCYDELKALLLAANVADEDIDGDFWIKETALVVLTGDLVRKGTKNLEVLRWASQKGAYAVTGNHEIRCQNTGLLDCSWLISATAEEIAYMDNLPWTLSIPDYNVVVVHAGLVPGNTLQQNTEYIMTLMRNLEWDGIQWIPHERPEDGGVSWGSQWDGSLGHVVFGHDAGRGYFGPQEHQHATGLDTRCVSAGQLTGIFLPVANKEYVVTSCLFYSDTAE